MILTAIILVPLIGGMLAWLAARRSATASRWITLFTLLFDLALVGALAKWAPVNSMPLGTVGESARWWNSIDVAWIPQAGIHFHLAVDGLSFLLLLLTVLLGIASVACSWKEIQERVGFFHFNLLAILSGIMGVFLALDLFLFYFFWELMLIPMYFLISIWGHENRTYAAIKFFLFTQASGLLMFLSILGLFFIHGRTTGIYTFDYEQLLGTQLSRVTGMWLMLGFFVAFAVKIPLVPLHTWLPDAHTEAPTAGSVILAGLLLKTGAYGMLRFVLPLFPDAAHSFAPVAMALGVIGILYGAVLAFAQRDLKRLVAYTSVSHMGFVVLGIFTFGLLSLQGAVVQMLCHGLSTGALFILVGALQERIHTRDMERMGGLWTTAPRMGAMALFFAIASLGLPGLGNFVAEFLVLAGAFQTNVWMTAIAAAGLVTSAIYALWLVQRAFQGVPREEWRIRDFGAREMAILLTMAGFLIAIGFYPQPILNIAEPVLRPLQRVSFVVSPSSGGEMKARVTGVLATKSGDRLKLWDHIQYEPRLKAVLRTQSLFAQSPLQTLCQEAQR